MIELPLQMHGSGSDRVAVLMLTQPGRPVVVLDEELIVSLDQALNQVPTGIRGLVLASGSERSFVAGADLKSIVERDDAELRAYLKLGSRVFARFSAAPYPTAAAIRGAALGGGLELAMHCDGLIGAPSPSGKPYPVGLPECGLSICPGWGGTNLLPARMEPRAAIEMAATGKTFMDDQARQAGVFDEVAEADVDVVERACAWVRRQPVPTRDGAPRRWIGRPDCKVAVSEALSEVGASGQSAGSAKAVLDAVGIGVRDGWQAAVEAEREHLIRLRHTPEARGAIEAFFARSKK
ncbi:MAG: enoyl-CoA hydratase/isomerase family protein [Phycisphaerales bacterium]|nr:enoyl-CoA hydratase/isomerase family protein [Phycisphaerales bacterium]